MGIGPADVVRYVLRSIDRAFTLSVRAKLDHAGARLLRPTVCVDIGASYFAHGPWYPFLLSPSVTWIAVEPNAANTRYLDTWRWPARARLEPVGLSEHGGEQELFVTNVDSGSSLLAPEITPNMEHRVDRGYLFPCSTRRVATRRLTEVIPPGREPVVLKLDTQGTELVILRGAEPLFEARRCVAIESEATLLAEPCMKGAGKFWQMCEFLEGRGFELIHIKPIQGGVPAGHHCLPGNTYLNECDAVFTLRRSDARGRPVDHQLTLFVTYLCYRLYAEAAALFQDIPDIDAICRQAGVDPFRIRRWLRVQPQRRASQSSSPSSRYPSSV